MSLRQKIETLLSPAIDVRAPYAMVMVSMIIEAVTAEIVMDARGTMSEKPSISSDVINALPEPLRRYIMWIETECDPQGTIRENFRLREENAGLRKECEHLASGGPYLVWSNEHRAWWRPNRCGYTRYLHAAGRYSRTEAISIAAGARDGWAKGGAPPEIALPERDALEALASARQPQ